MGDINKVTLVGTAITKPSFVELSSKTPMIVFTLKLKEIWKNRRGERQQRGNLINIEVTGKNSFKAKDLIKVGRRYHIDGYLRSDPINGKEEVRVRCFHIEEEDDEQFNEGLKEGFGRAFALIDNSDDIGVAKSKLKILLEG